MTDPHKDVWQRRWGWIGLIVFVLMCFGIYPVMGAMLGGLKGAWAMFEIIVFLVAIALFLAIGCRPEKRRDTPTDEARFITLQ